MPLISMAPWLDSELDIVADSGLRCGHCFALAAGNRYKAELRNTASPTVRKMRRFLVEPAHEV